MDVFYDTSSEGRKQMNKKKIYTLFLQCFGLHGAAVTLIPLQTHVTHTGVVRVRESIPLLPMRISFRIPTRLPA